MNSYYLIVFFGFILAQCLMASIQVYNYQKEKQIKYLDALAAYFKAELGYFIIGIIAISCVLFLISDYIDLSITKQDLKSMEHRTWKENLQLYFRTGSICIGAFVQYLAFKFKDKGKDAIDKAADKI